MIDENKHLILTNSLMTEVLFLLVAVFIGFSLCQEEFYVCRIRDLLILLLLF